jgi:anti-sigma factor RsiW
MNRDQLEFAITQYLDGTLPPQQVSALEQLLQTDELARELLAEHQRLDAIFEIARQATAPPALDWDRIATTISDALPVNDTAALAAASLPLPESTSEQDLDSVLGHAWSMPEINWAKVARQLSAAVTAGADAAATPVDESFEQQLVRYADGELSADEAAVVEARLTSDPAARLTLSEYRSLDRILKAAPGVEDVDWNAYAAETSQAIEEQAEAAQRRRLQITTWVRRVGAAAIAACVVIGSLVGYRAFNRPETIVQNPQPDTTQRGARKVIEVALEAPEGSPGPALVEVNVGPSESYVRGSFDRYSPGIVSTNTPRLQLAITTPVAYEGSGLLD